VLPPAPFSPSCRPGPACALAACAWPPCASKTALSPLAPMPPARPRPHARNPPPQHVGLVATAVVRCITSTPPSWVYTPLEHQPASSAPVPDLRASLGFKRPHASPRVPCALALKHPVRAACCADVPRVHRECAAPHGPVRRHSRWALWSMYPRRALAPTREACPHAYGPGRDRHCAPHYFNAAIVGIHDSRAPARFKCPHA
jgi:hypothetical protein